jgi:hypothetical protein
MLVLDCAQRLVPNIETSAATRASPEIPLFLTCTPLSPRQDMTHREFVCFLAMWGIALAPVTLCRVALLGCALGTCGGTAAWVVASRLAIRYENWGGAPLLAGFCTHNYVPPSFWFEREESGARTLRSAEITPLPSLGSDAEAA